jgi:hypothetical protein
MIKKSKELIDNFDLGWKGNVKARVHSANLDNKYREKIMILYLELKLRPISIIKIKSNYWMKLLEIALLFYLEYKWKCKTIIKNDQHKEIRSYRYWVKCYAFINSKYRRTGGKRAQFNKSSLVRVPIRLGQDAFTVGEISEENIDRMCDAMTAFNL